MKIIKCAIVFGALIIGANANLLAQEKEKVAVKQELKSKSNEDEVITKLNHKMENATPEERVQIQKKIEAYKAEKSNYVNDYGKNNEGFESKGLNENRAVEAKEKIQEAYLEVERSNQRIEIAAARIKAAEEELYEAEKNKSLSEEELTLRKEKLENAKTQLQEAQHALKKQKEALDTKRADMVKKGQ